MTDAVQVVVRVRPLNEKEISQGGNQSIIRVQQNGIHVSNPKVLLDPSYSTDNRVFYFDKCFSSDSPKSPEYADQEKIYSEIGQSVVENASSGFNCCIFAYGQVSVEIQMVTSLFLILSRRGVEKRIQCLGIQLRAI